MKAEEYLLSIGFDNTLPEIFNDDDKSYYSITELMESYSQSQLKEQEEKHKKAVNEAYKKGFNQGYYDPDFENETQDKEDE